MAAVFLLGALRRAGIYHTSLKDFQCPKRPTIRKAEERYEALRKREAGKEKAVRIANTPPSQAGKRGGNAEPYEEWTKVDLLERAQELDIAGRSDMGKEELIAALRNR